METFDVLKNSLDKLDIKWRVQTMIDEDVLWGGILHSVVSNGNHAYRFICGVKKYTPDITNVINTANSIIYDNLSSFNILCNKDHDIIIFAGSVYRYSSFHGYDILNDEKAYQIV